MDTDLGTDELALLMRALARRGLADGDWVCSLRTRVTGQLSVERGGTHPRVVVETDLGCLSAGTCDDCAALSEWQRCAPGSAGARA